MATQKNGNGALRAFISLFVFCTTLALGITLLIALQPQDLSDIEGNRKGRVPEPRDLTVVLSKAVKGKYPVTLSELELNRTIAKRVKGEQKGALGGLVKMEEVLVRLEEDVAELIVVRSIFGHELTSSMFIKFISEDKEESVQTRVELQNGGLFSDSFGPALGGRFGKLPIPQGFLSITFPDFTKVAAAMKNEINLGFEKMARFEIQDSKLILDPNGPKDESAR